VKIILRGCGYRARFVPALWIAPSFCQRLLLLFATHLTTLVIVLLGLAGRRLPAHGGVLALASMCLGLLVSAFVSTSEKVMPFLVMLTMGQITLSGGVLPLAGMSGLAQLPWIAPARWGFAACASTVNLNILTPPTGSNTNPLWNPSSSSWYRDIGLTVLIGALCLLLTWISLRRLRQRRRRGTTDRLCQRA
jgi:hypothetical protein